MTLVEILKQSLIFSGLSEKDLQVLSGIVVRHSFTKGERLFNEGEAADGFYLLVSGQVKLCKVSSDGREKVLHFVKPMETFAEAAFFGTGTYPAECRATEGRGAVPAKAGIYGAAFSKQFFRAEPGYFFVDGLEAFCPPD